jgi:hypothetical protein
VRCPDCKSKLTAENYDPEFEWYECSSCEGSFTADEILKAEMQGGIVKASGKVRRTQLELDETLAATIQVPKISSSAGARAGRLQVPSRQIVNIISDVVEDVYRQLGSNIDRVNAEDKALTLYRAMVYEGTNTTVKEHEFQLPYCKEHGDLR